MSFLKPPTSFMATFKVAGGGSPLVPLITDPVGADLLERDGVEPGRHVGPVVLRAADLVEELGGDRADRDLAPVPSCLPMTQEPSPATSAQGNPTWVMPATSVKKE